MTYNTNPSSGFFFGYFICFVISNKFAYGAERAVSFIQINRQRKRKYLLAFDNVQHFKHFETEPTFNEPTNERFGVNLV